MTSYSVLVGPKNVEGSIRYWVNWNKAPAENILKQAESWIYARLRCREMIARETGSILDGASTMTLPNGFRGVKSLRLTGDYVQKLTLRDHRTFDEIITYDTDGSISEGTPCEFTYDGTTIYFNVEADVDYTYAMWYFKAGEALAKTSNETNFLTDRYLFLLQASCLYIANMQRKDTEEANRWLGIALEEIRQANAELDMEMAEGEYEIHWGER